MSRKTPWNAYLKLKKYKGSTILSSNEVRKLFGYSKNTAVHNGSMSLFVEFDGYTHPTSYWKLHTNCSAVLLEDLPDSTKEKFNYRFPSLIPYEIIEKFKDDNHRERYLIKDSLLPFWKLKKYGGYII